MKLLYWGGGRGVFQDIQYKEFHLYLARVRGESKVTEEWDESPCADPGFAVGVKHCYSQIPSFAFTITFWLSLGRTEPDAGRPHSDHQSCSAVLGYFPGAKGLEPPVPGGTSEPRQDLKGNSFFGAQEKRILDSTSWYLKE